MSPGILGAGLLAAESWATVTLWYASSIRHGGLSLAFLRRLPHKRRSPES